MVSGADYKCGYLPREFTLKRGERQKLIFWSDQVYDQPPPATESSSILQLEITTQNQFLEAVNLTDPEADTEADIQTTTLIDQDDTLEITTTVTNAFDTEAIDEIMENVELAQALEEFGSNDEPQDTTEEAIISDDSATTTAGFEEPTSEQITTFPPEPEIAAQDLNDIAYDDDDAEEDGYFQEDFGTPINNQAQTIVDPLDDIADIVNDPVETLVHHPHVEFIETSDPPATVLEVFDDDESEMATTSNPHEPSDLERVFDYTTIAFPVGEDAKPSKPTFEAVVAEEEHLGKDKLSEC